MIADRRPLACGHPGDMAFHLSAHRRPGYRPGWYCLMCGRNLCYRNEVLPEAMRAAVVALREAVFQLGPNVRVKMEARDAL
jgi:hypothetical protein